MLDTLYYDGQCPLCSKEIAVLKRWQRGGLAFVDIHSLDSSNDLSRQIKMLQILHLRRGDIWLTGVDATVAAWSHTPVGLLFKTLRLPLLSVLVDKAYMKWAKRRYEKLYGQWIVCGECQ